MRQIGHLENEVAARTFGNFLYVQGVENEVEADAPQGWAVWIHSEDELERAAKLLAEFRADPANPRYRLTAAGADELRALAEKERAAYARKSASGREIVQTLHAGGLGLVPLVLIIISAVVFLLQQSPGTAAGVHRWLYMVNVQSDGEFVRWMPGLTEIRAGEIWRLFTPMFLHFGIAHILFNLFWLRELGRMIELRQGSWFLTLLVLTIAATSNFGQYLRGGPMFGGMSGVVFGLFGYVWMRAKFTPWSGYVIHPTTVMMQLLWLGVCFTGLVGPIANTCHTVGLAVGVAWGWIASRARP